MIGQRRRRDGAPLQSEARSPVYVRVSPLIEIDDLVAFGEALARIPGVRSQDLVEFEDGTALYEVVSGSPATMLTAIQRSDRFAIERAWVNPAGELDVRLATPPLSGGQPRVLAVRVQARRPPGRWLLGSAVAVLVAGGVVIFALAHGSSQPTAPVSTVAGRPAAAATVTSLLPPPAQGVPATATDIATPAAPSPTTVAPTIAATALATASALPFTPAATPPPESRTANPVANAETGTPATPTAAGRAAVSLSAADVAALLQQRGLRLGTWNADPAVADPNHLLGQPGAYTSVVRFQDKRLAPIDNVFDLKNGGVVEVFATAADAERRLTYLHRIGAVVPDAREYDYRRGTVVLRLSQRLTPNQANAYATALDVVVPAPGG